MTRADLWFAAAIAGTAVLVELGVGALLLYVGGARPTILPK